MEEEEEEANGAAACSVKPEQLVGQLAGADVVRSPAAFDQLLTTVLPARTCALRTLRLRDCGLGHNELRRLAAALHNNTTLLELDVRGNARVDDRALGALAAGFTAAVNIRTVRCDAFDTTAVRLRDVGHSTPPVCRGAADDTDDAALDGPAGDVLDLRERMAAARCGLGEGALTLLGRALRNNTAVRTVLLRTAFVEVAELRAAGGGVGGKWARRGLGPEDVELAAATLAFDDTCGVLDVSFNHLGERGTVALQRLLQVRAGVKVQWIQVVRPRGPRARAETSVAALLTRFDEQRRCVCLRVLQCRGTAGCTAACRSWTCGTRAWRAVRPRRSWGRQRRHTARCDGSTPCLWAT
jgi:hypothetical protein